MPDKDSYDIGVTNHDLNQGICSNIITVLFIMCALALIGANLVDWAMSK